MELGKKILLVFSELPYPARLNGISIRYAPIITELARRHDVHVAIIVRPDESRYPEGLDLICKSVEIFRRGRVQASLAQRISTRVAKCFSSDVPYPLYSYDNAEIERFLRTADGARAYDSIVWVGSMHLEIGIKVFGGQRIVHDAIDSLYHGHLRKRQRSLFHSIDGAKIAAWERHLIRVTGGTSFVSRIDAELFVGDSTLARKVAVFPNGVFLGDFASSHGAAANDGVVTLGFLGHMGYQPNIEAALRLSRIFAAARASDPGFRLLIIGRDPAPEVLALAEKEGVEVTGSVADIWEYIAKVDIFVFPMVSGAGQQNKVLEAMYGGKAVVCNSLANSGIGALDDTHLLIRKADDEFVAAILGLKRSPEDRLRIAQGGAEFVREKYSWEKIIPLVEQFWLSAKPAAAARG
jgi:glycosyltransferase involved in cell wall biosynthesis